MKLRVTFALFVCLLFFTSSSAYAQMSEGEKKAAARAAYTEGVDLQDKGKPADALSRFEAAQTLFDAPTHLLHIAECQVLTGKLVEAAETYELLSRKTLPAGSPDAFVQAQQQGQAEVTALRQRIPTMRVSIKPEPKTLQNLQININDKQMPVEMVGIARPVNPGSYKLSASATGYGTPNATEITVVEKDAKTVDLTLVQGATAAVVGTPTDPKTGGPAPYEAPKPTTPTDGPSSAGLLFGIRPGIFVPVGDVAKNVKFDQYASAGPGVGVDVIGRVARIFLVGGTLEIASLGAPNANAFPSGTKAEVGTTSVYLGVLLGILPNVDKVSFIADAGLGLRLLSHTVTLTTAPGVSNKDSETYSGIEASLAAGVSIPAGPIRIVPKAGIALGQFTDRSCTLGAATTVTNCGGTAGAAADVNSSFHSILNVVLGVYYHLDFSKKSGAASTTPAPGLMNTAWK